MGRWGDGEMRIRDNYFIPQHLTPNTQNPTPKTLKPHHPTPIPTINQKSLDKSRHLTYAYMYDGNPCLPTDSTFWAKIGRYKNKSNQVR
jgi:hypothetical protein